MGSANPRFGINSRSRCLWNSFYSRIHESIGRIRHILDVSELLRIVQAAEMIAARGVQTTPMMAFDYYLLERVKKTLDAKTLCIEVLFRFGED
jgi:hypothetical protein